MRRSSRAVRGRRRSSRRRRRARRCRRPRATPSTMLPPSVARFLICGEPTVEAASASAVRSSSSAAMRENVTPGADRDAARRRGPRPSARRRGTDRAGTAGCSAAEVDPDHQVGPAGDDGRPRDARRAASSASSSVRGLSASVTRAPPRTPRSSLRRRRRAGTAPGTCTLRRCTRRTLARHSSAVPEAVISWTTSSGTSPIARSICSCVAGQVRIAPISSSSVRRRRRSPS